MANGEIPGGVPWVLGKAWQRISWTASLYYGERWVMRVLKKPYCHCESEAATRDIGLREGTTNEHE